MFHSQIITQIISSVGTKQKTDNIFTFSKKHYDLHQFNVGSLDPKDVRKMNESLKRRYKHQQIEILPTNWNQGQRRLFVWFIICFLYEKKVQIEHITELDLKSLSTVFYGKDTIFLDFQLRNLPKVTKSKRNWSTEEDDLLRKAIMLLKGQTEDTKLFNNWNDVAKIMFFQTERRIFRTPKSCRERWYNHLDESKKKDDFSLEEDLILINFILKESKSWSKIVKILNYSRTEHRIKNRYYTLIRKYQRGLNSGLQNQELTEEMEKEIISKLKIMLEEVKGSQQNPNQMLENKSKIQNDEVKMEDQCSKSGLVEEETIKKILQSPSSNDSSKLKTQSNPSQFEYISKIKIYAQQEIEQKSLSFQLKENQNSNGTITHASDSNAHTSNVSLWTQNYIPYAQYIYHMNMYNQVQYEPAQNQMVINQFYCPMVLPNNMDYQMFYQG